MKQGYKARMDESLGMRNGKESMMKQSYKARRDESMGMKSSMAKSYNEQYKAPGVGMELGQASAPKKTSIDVGSGFKKVKEFKCGPKY